MTEAVKGNFLTYLLVAFVATSLLAFFEVNYALTLKYILSIVLILTFVFRMFYKTKTGLVTNLLLLLFFTSFFVLDFIFFVQLNLTWLYFFQILFTISSILLLAVLLYGFLQKRNQTIVYSLTAFSIILILIIHADYQYIPLNNSNELTALSDDVEVNYEDDLSALETYLTNHNVVGAAVGFIKADKINYYSYGTLDKQTVKPPNRESVFQIASVSKVFTGLMLSTAIMDKRISLNDPVTISLKHKREDKLLSDITYKKLVTNTSGLPDLTASGTYWKEFIKSPLDPYKSSKVRQFTNVLNTTSINQDSIFEYSNIGFSLLAYSLTDMYDVDYNNGIGYDELLQKKICAVLGLENTTYFPNEAQIQHLSSAYSPLGFELPHWEHHMYHGAGGLYSTAEDLARFIQSQMSLSGDSLSQAMNLTHQTYFQDDIRKLGMPWNIENEGEVFWYTGYSYGNTSYIGFNKRTKKGMVILSNTFCLDIAKQANQLLMK
jgi:CubicO group peptidase (beta-lactamase class C family)